MPNGTDAAWAVYVEAQRAYNTASAASASAYEALPKRLREPLPVACVKNGRGGADSIYSSERLEELRAADPMAGGIFGPERKKRRDAWYDDLRAELEAKRAAFDAERVDYDRLSDATDEAWEAVSIAEKAVLAAPVLAVVDVRRVLELAEPFWRDADDFDSRCALAALEGVRNILAGPSGWPEKATPPAGEPEASPSSTVLPYVRSPRISSLSDDRVAPSSSPLPPFTTPDWRCWKRGQPEHRPSPSGGVFSVVTEAGRVVRGNV